MVGRTSRRVELDAPRFPVRVDETGEEAGTVHSDLAPRELARDHPELVLLADARLVAREADGREGADDQQEGCDESHRSRIGTPSDSLYLAARVKRSRGQSPRLL
jgi:hypothetical protein